MAEHKFTLERVPGAPVSDKELLSDIKRVAELIAPSALSWRSYVAHGKYHSTTVAARFKTWNRAIAAAGLKPASEKSYSDERLFENLMLVWEHYGRQPRGRELKKPPSKISDGPYLRRFRSWTNALEAFVAYANSQGAVAPALETDLPSQSSNRSVSLRTRFRILKRDNFRCCSCGASPALTPGLVLHVDHNIAWSKGGDSDDANLQTLCKPCNQGKSNVL